MGQVDRILEGLSKLAAPVEKVRLIKLRATNMSDWHVSRCELAVAGTEFITTPTPRPMHRATLGF